MDDPTPLPRYRSHKRVWALKIRDVLSTEDGGFRLAFFGIGDTVFDNIVPTEEYMLKHQPVAGGYWVRYEDGYESFSPPEPFEGGYTLLGIGTGAQGSGPEVTDAD